MTTSAATTLALMPGASELAVILGLGRTTPSDEPYTSTLELWSRLVGLTPRYDLAPSSPDAEIGRWSEVAVLHRLASERGWSWGTDIIPGPPLSQPGFTAPGCPWAARPDAVAPAVPATIEAKSPRSMPPADWSDTDPPPYYLVQVLGQVAIGYALHGIEVGILASMARAPGYGSPRVWAIYEIRRDAQRERLMMDRVRRWLDEHVIGGHPPPPDGSESADRTLKRLWSPVDERVHEATPTDVERYHRWLQSRTALDEIQGRTDELRQHLQQSMGPATVMVGPDREQLVTWRARTDGVRVFQPARRRRNTTARPEHT